MKTLFLLYGIKAVTAIKVWWLGLNYLSAILELLLVWRLSRRWGYRFPGLCCYLGACALYAVVGSTRSWGLWGEALMSAGAALYILEVVHGRGVAIVSAIEQGYIRNTIYFIGGIALAVTAMSLPRSFPGYPRLPYYWHIFTVIAGYVILASTAGYHWWRGTVRASPFFENNLIGIVWFFLPVSSVALMPVDGKPFTPQNYPWVAVIVGLIIQIGCLLAWHWFMIGFRVSRAVGVPSAPAIAR
jgi:hypothetical protein